MKDLQVGDRILNYSYNGYTSLKMKWLTVERVTPKMIYLGSGRTIEGVSKINKEMIDRHSIDTGLPLRSDVFLSDMSDVDDDFLETVTVQLHEAIDQVRSVTIEKANHKYNVSMDEIRRFRGENR